MAASYDLVVLHGPLTHGYVHVLQERLGSVDSYQHILPFQLYRDHPEYGVRDVANIIVNMLRKKHKVVVSDFSPGAGLRECLWQLMRKKIPSCKALSLQLVPEYGEDQVFWSREFCLACEDPHVTKFSDQVLQHLFEETKDSYVNHHGNSNLESIANILTKECIRMNLMAISQFKFEIPALLLQWESVCVVTSGLLREGVVRVCQEWSRATHCGRIIIVWDNHSVLRGHESASQQKATLISCVKELASKLDCPVYVLHIVSTKDAGDFCVPPSPGMLAFLQHRHCLDLGHQSTMYIYSDAKHMKMAEKAGIRHIQISKAVGNPDKMSLCHSAIACEIPTMLKNMQVNSDNTDPGQAVIPLGDKLAEFCDGHICVNHPLGHREYVFAKTLSTLQRFQDLYHELATPLAEKCSRLTISHQMYLKKVIRGSTDASSTPQIDLTKETLQPGLEIPKWMVRRSRNLLPEATLSSSASSSSNKGTGRTHQTVYIMTEKELLETAMEILKQAETKVPPRSGEPALGMSKSEPALLNTTDCESGNTSHAQDGGPVPSVQADVNMLKVKSGNADLTEAPTAEHCGILPTKKARLEESGMGSIDPSSTTQLTQDEREDTLVAELDSAPPVRKAPPQRKVTKEPNLSILDEIFF